MSLRDSNLQDVVHRWVRGGCGLVGGFGTVVAPRRCSPVVTGGYGVVVGWSAGLGRSWLRGVVRRAGATVAFWLGIGWRVWKWVDSKKLFAGGDRRLRGGCGLVGGFGTVVALGRCSPVVTDRYSMIGQGRLRSEVRTPKTLSAGGDRRLRVV